jgi:hypothetical protein
MRLRVDLMSGGIVENDKSYGNCIFVLRRMS